MGPQCLIEYVTLLHHFFHALDLSPMSFCGSCVDLYEKRCEHVHAEKRGILL